MDQKELKELLVYEPDTGLFRWAVSRKKASAGKVAGSIMDTGHVRIETGGVRYLAHRLAWLYMTGDWPAGWVDHKDGDPGNNQWQNLRLASPTQNNWNRKPNASGLKGVSYVPRRKKWRAQIRVDGKKKEIGVFQTPEEAHDAYCREAEKLHGKWYRHG